MREVINNSESQILNLKYSVTSEKYKLCYVLILYNNSVAELSLFYYIGISDSKYIVFTFFKLI